MGSRLSFLEPAGKAFPEYLCGLRGSGRCGNGHGGRAQDGPSTCIRCHHNPYGNLDPTAALHERTIPWFSLEGLLRASQSSK